MKYVIPSGLMNALDKNKTYSKFEACFDILTLADDNGNLHFTKRELMDRWGWGSSKTVSFISQLESWNVIIRPKTDHETDQKQTTKYRINTSFMALEKTKNRPLNRPQADHKINDKNHEICLENIGIYERIINYLNERCGTRYKCKNKEIMTLIQERINEGFTEDDFYIVINKKATEWMGNNKMQQFLRPSTLFRGDKFEGYLNQMVIEQKSMAQQEFDDFCNLIDNWAEQKEMEGVRHET